MSSKKTEKIKQEIVKTKAELPKREIESIKNSDIDEMFENDVMDEVNKEIEKEKMLVSEVRDTRI
jgi:hypothetical protein